ncbi:malignant fibrous histiocytoma-amplified sequence 1 homolog [Protopterus annectens]|uniref:malignant fibrous histiocytoma-amplified sequence 1 homolog n=1 Tax=Protopterus annectens TaxID=7888 RepID=UPI001CFB3CE2|nr:malignant fibrous histiocytoma-amplified sequence 1 homolog [Protopterus annectens]
MSCTTRYEKDKADKQQNLASKRLKVIPPEVLSNVEIEFLNLDRNKLKNVIGISELKKLKELALSKNELAEFPVEIKNLRSLEKLEINQNKMQNIPEGIFCSLHRLKHLKLNNNRISKLPDDLSNCGGLEYFNISSNWIRVIPPCILTLKKLVELYVGNNKLRKLPAELFENKVLKKFNARSNPLREPPDEVCSGGLKQIRNYFSQLQKSDAEEVKKIKTIFLGESMAGKSTICKSLCMEPEVVPTEERTVGIEINEFPIEDFTFYFWDFAGQHEYYLTHHVFITPQAFVILVINLQSYSSNDENFKSHVQFWISNVLMRVPDSVVLPVGTHIDCCDKEAVEVKKKDIVTRIREMLEERKKKLDQKIKFMEENNDPEMFLEQVDNLKQLANCRAKVLDLVAINCKNHDDIKQLRATILECVREEEDFPNAVKILPLSYRAVEKAILEMSHAEDFPAHGMMSLDELFSSLGKKEKLGKVEKEVLKDILRYLHRTGLIVWYEEIDMLANKVFVKPGFLIELFKTIIRHDIEKQLKNIPVAILTEEKAFSRDVKSWIAKFKCKAMLDLKAMRAMVKHLLQPMKSDERTDVIDEMLGGTNEEGKLFNLFVYFQICLPVRNANGLNVKAPEFIPGKKWEPTADSKVNSYLFPIYLLTNTEVTEQWKHDHEQDLCFRFCFLPEIPEGFFQRLIVEVCSLYSSHWVGRTMCLVVYIKRQVLLKEIIENNDYYIEMTSRKPGNENDFRNTWKVILAIYAKIRELLEQWPGLYLCVRTPCRNKNCLRELEWPDIDENTRDSAMTQEETITCDICGSHFASAFLFPYVPFPKEVPQINTTINVTTYGGAVVGSGNVLSVGTQNFEG